MCTIIMIANTVPHFSLVLAANRDEFLHRPASPPCIWRKGGIRIVSGRDLQEGGTWLGVNQFGMVCGLTNRYTAGGRNSHKSSRGGLIAECLTLSRTQEVEKHLLHTDMARYNPFNLFFFAKGRLTLATNHPALRMHKAGDGICILTNEDVLAPQSEKIQRIRRSLDALPEQPDRIPSFLMAMLADHDGDPDTFPFPVCVHKEGYGTVSASILMLADDPAQSQYFYADGHPCGKKFQNYSAQLTAILRNL